MFGLCVLSSNGKIKLISFQQFSLNSSFHRFHFLHIFLFYPLFDTHFNTLLIPSNFDYIPALQSQLALTYRYLGNIKLFQANSQICHADNYHDLVQLQRIKTIKIQIQTSLIAPMSPGHYKEHQHY